MSNVSRKTGIFKVHECEYIEAAIDSSGGIRT